MCRCTRPETMEQMESTFASDNTSFKSSTKITHFSKVNEKFSRSWMKKWWTTCEKQIRSGGSMSRDRVLEAMTKMAGWISTHDSRWHPRDLYSPRKWTNWMASKTSFDHFNTYLSGSQPQINEKRPDLPDAPSTSLQSGHLFRTPSVSFEETQVCIHIFLYKIS